MIFDKEAELQGNENENIFILFYEYLEEHFHLSQCIFQVFKWLIWGGGFDYLLEMNLRQANEFAGPGRMQQVCLQSRV